LDGIGEKTHMDENNNCITLLKWNVMKIIKVIEIIASSETSFDDAAKNAINEASKSIQNIQSLYIKEMNAKVENNQIISFGIIAKISFEVDNGK